jgi:hypothetical protein
MSRAWVLLAAAGADIIAGGVAIAATWHLSFWHGLYCSIGTASTVGCDTAPRTGLGQAVAVGIMLTAVPLLAAVFTQLHLDRIDAHMAAHRKLLGADLRQHRQPRP